MPADSVYSLKNKLDMTIWLEKRRLAYSILAIALCQTIKGRFGSLVPTAIDRKLRAASHYSIVATTIQN